MTNPNVLVIVRSDLPSLSSGGRVTLSRDEMLEVEGGKEFLNAAALYGKTKCVEFNLNALCEVGRITAGNFQCLSQEPGSVAQFVHIDIGGEGIQVRLSVFACLCCIRARVCNVSYVDICQLLVFLHS